MENKSEKELNEFMIESVNQAFIMGMNYQRLTTLETLQNSPLDFSMESKNLLGEVLDLFKEATIADLPTTSND